MPASVEARCTPNHRKGKKHNKIEGKTPLRTRACENNYTTFLGRPPRLPFARAALVFLSDFDLPPLRPIVPAAAWMDGKS